MGKILFVFIDGIGLAPASEHNVFASGAAPTLQALLGGPLIRGSETERPGLLLLGLDACLGVEGLPQSATGQTALFTGINAPAVVQAHISAWPTQQLRTIIAEHSFLKRATEMGHPVTFANAFNSAYWKMIEQGKRRPGASTLSALAAQIPLRTFADLTAGRALMWDITHEIFGPMVRNGDVPLPASEVPPVISARQAGYNLVGLCADYDLVFYETFLTDLVGHRRLEIGAETVLRRLDDLLAGALEKMPADTTLVICSDHGNFEDSSTRMHTENPVPLLVVGPDSAYFRHARAITDVTPAMLACLRGDDGQQTRDESPLSTSCFE